jgi:hypothetical protein
MARTTTVIRLQSLANASRAASRAGTDIDEAVGRKHTYLSTDEGLTRR